MRTVPSTSSCRTGRPRRSACSSEESPPEHRDAPRRHRNAARQQRASRESAFDRDGLYRGALLAAIEVGLEIGARPQPAPLSFGERPSRVVEAALLPVADREVLIGGSHLAVLAQTLLPGRDGFVPTSQVIERVA